MFTLVSIFALFSRLPYRPAKLPGEARRLDDGNAGKMILQRTGYFFVS